MVCQQLFLFVTFVEASLTHGIKMYNGPKLVLHRARFKGWRKWRAMSRRVFKGARSMQQSLVIAFESGQCTVASRTDLRKCSRVTFIDVLIGLSIVLLVIKKKNTCRLHQKSSSKMLCNKNTIIIIG